MQSILSFNLSSIFKKYFLNYSELSSDAWQGILIAFIESTLVGIAWFLSVYFVKELHLEIENAGIILSCYGLGTIFGGFLGGKLSDRISSGVVSVISLLLQSIAYLFLIKIRSISFLMIDLFFVGLGAYGFITSNYLWVLARCQSHSERLKAINLLSIASNLGLGVSAVVISFLTNSDFTSVFFISGFLLFLTAIYLIFKEKQSINNNHIFEDSTLPINRSIDNQKKIKTIVCYVLACLFLVGMIISQMNATYPIYLERIFPKMGTKSFGLLFTFNTIIVVLFQAPIIDLIKNKNNIFMIGLGALLLGIGMLMLSFTSIFMLAILSCLITTIGEILFFSISQLVCYENVRRKGESLGIYRMIFAASRIVGPAAGSFIYQKFGGIILWYTCGFLGVLCFVPAIYFQNKFN